jgi:hypothetical protein
MSEILPLTGKMFRLADEVIEQLIYHNELRSEPLKVGDVEILVPVKMCDQIRMELKKNSGEEMPEKFALTILGHKIRWEDVNGVTVISRTGGK